MSKKDKNFLLKELDKFIKDNSQKPVPANGINSAHLRSNRLCSKNKG
jgi:hypothetical protein